MKLKAKLVRHTTLEVRVPDDLREHFEIEVSIWSDGGNQRLKEGITMPACRLQEVDDPSYPEVTKFIKMVLTFMKGLKRQPDGLLFH